MEKETFFRGPWKAIVRRNAHRNRRRQRYQWNFPRTFPSPQTFAQRHFFAGRRPQSLSRLPDAHHRR
jgi:hypothetical protein